MVERGPLQLTCYERLAIARPNTETVPLASGCLEYKNALTIENCRVRGKRAMSGSAVTPGDACSCARVAPIISGFLGVAGVLSLRPFQANGHGVQRERTEQVAPHPLFHLRSEEHTSEPSHL